MAGTVSDPMDLDAQERLFWMQAGPLKREPEESKSSAPVEREVTKRQRLDTQSKGKGKGHKGKNKGFSKSGPPSLVAAASNSSWQGAYRERDLLGGDRWIANALRIMLIVLLFMLLQSVDKLCNACSISCLGLSLMPLLLRHLMLIAGVLSAVGWVAALLAARSPKCKLVGARKIGRQRVRGLRPRRKPLVFFNARTPVSVLHRVRAQMLARTARRRSLCTRVWAICRKTRNALMHALTGNGSVDFWWCYSQIAPSTRPPKAEFKKHAALLKCDAKLVQRLDEAGKSTKAVQILVSAAKRYGLGWSAQATLLPPTHASAKPSETVAAPKSGKGKGHASPQDLVRHDPPGQPASGVGKGRSESSNSSKKVQAASWTRAVPKRTEVKFTLIADEWSAPVVSDLTPGVAGVKFCESAEVAQAQVAKVRETSHPAAVIVKDKLPAEIPHTPIVFKVCRTEEGKTREVALWGFLYNVGKGEVHHRPGFDEVSIKGVGGTSTLLVEVAAEFCDQEVWQQIMQGKIHVMRKLVYEACAKCQDGVKEADIIDVFKLAKSGTIASAVVRVRSSAVQQCLVTSGHGVFFRPLGPKVEDFGVIWLKNEQAKDVQAALELAKQWKSQGALGLALRPHGLGIRAAKAHFDQLRTALGRDPSQTRYLVSNVPCLQ